MSATAPVVPAPPRIALPPAGPQRVDPVLELRQYTLRPGRRDALVELFEREFVEPQEAAGLHLLGQFHDLDAPDRFVWLRSCADHATRREALAAFYGGPAWRAHRAAANATMLDSDDVLLLRPARPAGGLALPPRHDDGAGERGVVVLTVHHLREADPAAFLRAFEQHWLPLLWDASIGLEASWVSDPTPNGFPALPVREGEPVFVWLRRHASRARADEAQARLDEALDWQPRLQDALAVHEARPPQVLRLGPTPRSRLRGA